MVAVSPSGTRRARVSSHGAPRDAATHPVTHHPHRRYAGPANIAATERILRTTVHWIKEQLRR
jgi:hypothetical protein